MKQFTEQEKEDIAYVRSLSTNNIARDIDLTDPRQKRFYMAQLRLAGVTREDYPQIHRSIDDISNGTSVQGKADVNAAAQPVNVIGQLTSRTVEGQKWETSSISSVPGGTNMTKMTLVLVDEDLEPIGPVGVADQYGGGTSVSVLTDGDFGTPMPPDGRDILSIGTMKWVDEGTGTTHLQNVFVGSSRFPKQINNISPVDVNRDGEIVVCLTRQDATCDYFKQYDGTVQVPIKGSIVYNSPIDMENGKPKNASNVIEIARAIEGGNPIKPPAGFNFFDVATVDGSTITWDLGWLSFGAANFDTGDKVYYVFNVTLDAGGQEVTAYITNAPSSYTPGSNMFNTSFIDPMIIMYGCLALGTLVIMEDGTLKPIEEVVVGDIVQSQNGSTLMVKSTVVGVEERPMCKIETEAGHSVLMSDGHPVITKRGVTLAKHLQVNDTVFTQEGTTDIIGIEKVHFPKSVHNLQLAPQSPEKELDIDQNTLFAGGILVGDQKMQWLYNSPQQQTIEDVLANADKKWHQDIKSAYRAGSLDIAKKVMTS